MGGYFTARLPSKKSLEPEEPEEPQEEANVEGEDLTEDMEEEDCTEDPEVEVESEKVEVKTPDTKTTRVSATPVTVNKSGAVESDPYDQRIAWSMGLGRCRPTPSPKHPNPEHAQDTRTIDEQLAELE